ncbi:MAG: RNA-binding transcriptional accessory protein [Bacilli bacterium]|nr:RNA-binding transcriptional accessory protein [Bacilli bacterium]
MNEEIIKSICLELNIKEFQVNNTLNMLSEGATIPFIARYRKEATGNLDENQISKINEVYAYQVNLLKRKEDVIRLIDEKGLLTPELQEEIMKATKLVEVEDLYRPFKEKKKTKATEAIKLGLEPLAKEIFRENRNIKEEAKKYLSDKVPNIDFALEQACFIVAENISDNASFRKYIRSNIMKFGSIKSTKKKKSEDTDKVYEMYYDYSEPVKFLKPHRVLAMNRGEKEGILSVSVVSSEEYLENYLKGKLIHRENDTTCLLENSIKDALKRLILPSVEREVRAELTQNAEESAIANFSSNLKNLLMQPPMKSKTVLGFDPAFRTGCKLAVISNTGEMEHIDVIYPHEPKNETEKSKAKILDLIDKYKIDIIAIGNGTASRESEAFVASVIKEAKREVSYIIVNEAGASVYSASKLAQAEFPTLHVEERSAVSIARRLIDPLSELVKIDPKSIGVGMYQHDVTQKKLDEELTFVVSTAVNSVGVNVNTASRELLNYISGLNKKMIDKMMEYKKNVGKILERKELAKVFSEKVYEQAIGFLRIPDGSNILDKTSIHPESYKVALAVLNKYDLELEDIGTDKIKGVFSNIDKEKLAQEVGSDVYTIEDIISSLISPLRDPRDEIAAPILKSDILTLDDLKVGMELEGTVRNVIDFGAFVDIGLKNDGLIHISQISEDYIKHPSEVLNVGDIVKCYVLEINKEKKKVALTLLEKTLVKYKKSLH